jgi:uncharacterized protein YdhG (YjbR/CyaY superfamily)
MMQCPKAELRSANNAQKPKSDKIETIDHYIAEQAEDVRPTLQKIRETIAAAAPGATEKISWQMPTFWQNGNIIHFAAFKKHISIFPGGEVTTIFADQLTEYKTAKGTIQFPLDKPVPYELIAEITRWRVSNLEKGKSSL